MVQLLLKAGWGFLERLETELTVPSVSSTSGYTSKELKVRIPEDISIPMSIAVLFALTRNGSI